MLDQLDFFAKLATTEIPNNIYYCRDWQSFKIKWIDSKVFALDCETKPLQEKSDGLNPYKNKIRLIQIGIKKEEVYVCDLDRDENKEEFLEVLRSTLASQDYIKVLHNAYFDLLHLKVHYCMDANNIRDTQILSKILYAGVKGFGWHSLKAVASRYNLAVDKTEQASNWSRLELTNSQIIYAANDVILTLQLYYLLGWEIKNHKQLSLFGKKPILSLVEIAKIECESIPAFVDCTYNGLPVDLIKAKAILKQYTDALDAIKKPLEDKLGMPYTSASTKLVDRIYEVFGIRLEIEDNKTYKKSANSATLFLASQEHPELVNLILSRSLKQSIDAIKRIIKCVESFDDNRLRGWFSSLGDTGTGRSTCSGGGTRNSFAGVNVQNIPNVIEHPLLKEFNLPPLRSIISAPNNKKLVVIDLAASHQRLVASKRLSGDAFLTKVLLDADLAKMSHAILASDIAKIKGLDYSPEYIESNRKTNPELNKLRAVSKTRFYSGLNMAGWRRVQSALLADFIVCSDEDAKASDDAFKKRYRGIFEFQRKTSYAVKARGEQVTINNLKYTRFTTVDGRLFHCLLTPSKTEGDRVNISDALAIQWLSPEAIAMKKAMIDFRLWLANNTKTSAKLISMVHDELDLEIDATDLEPAKVFAEIIANHFQAALGNSIPHGMELDPEKLIAQNYSEK